MTDSLTATYLFESDVFRFTEDILLTPLTLPAFDSSLGNLEGASIVLGVQIATAALVTDNFGSGQGFAGLDAFLNAAFEADFLPSLPIITAVGMNIPQPLVFGSATVISNGFEYLPPVQISNLSAVIGTEPLTIEAQTGGITNPTINGLYQPAFVDAFAVATAEITYVYNTGGNSGTNPNSANSSDFNADGWDDILFFNASTRTVGQFEMPSGDWSGIGNAGAGWDVLGLGLFDSDDGAADILWFNVNTRSVGRFDMVDGSVAGWSGIGRAGVGWEALGAGDFNGDGTDDILWFNDATNTVGQFRMSDGAASWQGIGTTGNGWEIAGIADVNGNGTDDILWWNAANRSLGQYSMSQTGKSWAKVATLGAGYEVADTGDFNADGVDDILLFNASTRQLGMFDMANGQANWIALGTAGTGWSIAGTGDFDKSGTDDILWRHSDGRIGQYQMDGSAYTWNNVGTAGSEWDVLL